MNVIFSAMLFGFFLGCVFTAVGMAWDRRGGVTKTACKKAPAEVNRNGLRQTLRKNEAPARSYPSDRRAEKNTPCASYHES